MTMHVAEGVIRRASFLACSRALPSLNLEKNTGDCSQSKATATTFVGDDLIIFHCGVSSSCKRAFNSMLVLCSHWTTIVWSLNTVVVIELLCGHWNDCLLIFWTMHTKHKKKENNFRVDSFRVSCQWLKGLKTILAILHLNLKMSFTIIFDMQHISFEILSPFCVVMSVICGHFCGCLIRGTINGRHN